MGKTIAKVQGILFLILTIGGFMDPNFLGMHHTMIHRIVHLLTAVLALYLGFAGTEDNARKFNIAGGVVYLVLVALGFLAPGLLASILGHPGPVTSADLMRDNIVHILLMVIFFVGAMRRPAPVTTR
ncbi:MAG: hypothetical protein H7X85_08170 [Thermoanaerobaculia bacterium]|nr:hypothetical protein [Thermoanaerobaculia bacterium]